MNTKKKIAVCKHDTKRNYSVCSEKKIRVKNKMKCFSSKFSVSLVSIIKFYLASLYLHYFLFYMLKRVSSLRFRILSVFKGKGYLIYKNIVREQRLREWPSK